MKHSKDMKKVTCKTCKKEYYKRVLIPGMDDYKNMQCYECYKKEN